MRNIDLFNYFGKMLIINIYAYFMCLKILNYKENSITKTIIIVGLSTIISALYVVTVNYINSIYIILVMYLTFSIIIKILLNQKLNYCFLLTNISFTLTYMIYLFAVMVTGIMVLNLIPGQNYDSPINIIIIAIIMIIIYIILTKIKRLKNGINFLKDTTRINEISNSVNMASIIILVILELLNFSKNLILNYILVWFTLIIIMCFIYWIQSQITKHYKNDMKSHTIEVQREEIEEHLKTIEEVKTENLKLATAVHKYNHRIYALEKALRDTAKNVNNTEFAEEISVFLKETEDISKGFAKESEVITKTLPLTNIAGIDNMFKFMQEEAINSGINFDLKINTSIHDLIDKIISKDKFETLLGDHLKDAMIAINSSDKTYKSILVILGIVDDCYELSIYDTGIEFEIETLLKLGKERITTHKDTGGSGIGFMTTFETLESTKASLIIEEYNPETTSYTKSVNIRFDGKNNYKIYSYRAEEIKNKNKDKKIIIKNIE